MTQKRMLTAPAATANTTVTRNIPGVISGIVATGNASGGTCIHTATKWAASAAVTHGTSAEYCMMPTLATSREKTAAARGVPNSAEKPALIPHMIIMVLSLSFNRSTSPSFPEILPPSCSAAPSRPALPPQRWVITVERKIIGAIRNGTFAPELTDAMIVFVPRSPLPNL